MTDQRVGVTSPEQFKALGHPARHRLLYALSEPATISQLAVRLETNKGNVAHHLKALVAAGLVQPAETRQVRGGTERYFERPATSLQMTGPQAAGQLPVALGAIAEELAAAAPDPLFTIRHLRLTEAQAATLRETLSTLVDTVVPASDDEPRYGVLVSMYQQPAGEPGG